MTAVLKLGGELLDDAPALRSAAAAIVALASRAPLVVVHGGGRAIDAELRRRGLTPTFADGLRVTDAETLESVVMVLAGRTNTQLVAAINAAGRRAIGLTGADAQIVVCVRAAPIVTQAGQTVDLGLVGEPIACNVALVEDLLNLGCVPVIASIGGTADGELLNVNADTLAAHLAAALGARRLIVAGTTPGVLDAAGSTIAVVTDAEIDRMTSSGSAHSGMVAKLAACRFAAASGVEEVSIVSGRGVADFEAAPGTKVMARSRRAHPAERGTESAAAGAPQQR